MFVSRDGVVQKSTQTRIVGKNIRQDASYTFSSLVLRPSFSAFQCIKSDSDRVFWHFVMYYIYGSVRAIPTYRVYRIMLSQVEEFGPVFLNVYHEMPFSVNFVAQSYVTVPYADVDSPR